MMAIRPRHWALALSMAFLVHCAVAAVVAPLSLSEPVHRTPGQGVAISFGEAGGMPASAPAAKAESAHGVEIDAVRSAVPPAPLSRSPEVEVAEVPAVAESMKMPMPESADAQAMETATLVAPVMTANLVETRPAAAAVAPTSTLVKSEAARIAAAAVISPPKPLEKPLARAGQPVQTSAAAEAVETSPSLTRAAPAEENAGAVPADALHLGDEADQALAALSPGAGGSPGSGSGTEASAGAEGGSPAEEAGFLAAVQAWLEQHKRYPRRSRLRNETGVVLVRFVLLQDGRVREYEVLESSGYATLDGAAAQLIERAQPMPRIPGPLGRAQLELVVPIAFRLR